MQVARAYSAPPMMEAAAPMVDPAAAPAMVDQEASSNGDSNPPPLRTWV
jgi:hypothetical protein